MSLFSQSIKYIHFIGIGGIGVSAIARMMLSEKKKVSGSDATLSEITKSLEKLGATIHEGHDSAHVSPKCDLVVYSPAVRGDNPELAAARERGIQTLSYPEMLGRISAEKKTIAVSGSHGKTTTTAMLAEIFVQARKNPTVVVGSLLRKEKSNFIGGKGEWFITEACEYKRSFLNLSPFILIITNIDNDHLDYFGTLRGVQKAFGELAQKIPKSGTIICNPNDPKVSPVLKGVRARVVDYTKEKIPDLVVPGKHNRENAKAARVAARVAKIPTSTSEKALATFQGVWRRLEYKGELQNGAFLYDDYAHHPTEIRATLSALRERYPKKRIFVLFQPHLYSRTKLLFKDFKNAFKKADVVIVTDIYAAREIDDGTIHARDIMGSNTHTTMEYGGDLKAAGELIVNKVGEGDVLVTMGAGNVYTVGDTYLRS